MIEKSQLAGGAQLAAYKYQSRGVEQGATPNKLVVKLGHQQEIIGFQAQRINNAAPLPPDEKKTLKKGKKNCLQGHFVVSATNNTAKSKISAFFENAIRLSERIKCFQNREKIRKMDAHSAFGHFFTDPS